ncbi:MAG: exodeoxyribonuclease VII large subunit [Treponema sp.]|nr:exodeoxyribonuclease VII large subunit [Treponema sp.]
MYRIADMTPPVLPEDTVFTVTQITDLIKEMIEGAFPAVVIEGEISNYRPAGSGHLYFTLKDDTSQISAVMFRSAASALKFTPKDGTLVRCTGKLTVYPARGNYQILITRMETAGAGNILQMLEDRKKKLASEGLFESSRKRHLPFFPRTIGIVTSPTGAALRDILQITKRRNEAVSVVIFPALVQGNDAAASIVRQIDTANRFHMCDVLIVGRGGGSLEDLLPFSDESVVRTIAASEIPIVSAVGHEIDWALSDYAADVRAPTPSAAAELVVPLKADIMQNLQSYTDELYNTIRQKAENMKLVVRTFNPDNLELQFRTIEQPLLAKFDNAKVALLQNMDARLRDTKQHIEMCMQILENASPETILARGYSMVRDRMTQQIVRDASQTKPGTELEIVPAKGKLTAQVLSVGEKNE